MFVAIFIFTFLFSILVHICLFMFMLKRLLPIWIKCICFFYIAELQCNAPFFQCYDTGCLILRWLCQKPKKLFITFFQQQSTAILPRYINFLEHGPDSC